MTFGRALRWAALAGVLTVSAVACSSFEAEPVSPSAEGGTSTGDASSPDVESDGAVSPEASGACSVGAAPAPFVKTAGAPGSLATDGAWIYWLESQKKIVRAGRTTCTTQPVAQAASVNALAVDSAWLVWGEPSYRAIVPATIGTSPTPATHAAELHRSALLHGETVFWSDGFSTIAACDNPCSSTSVASGAVTVTARLLAANATALFFFGTSATAVANSLWTRPFGPTSTVLGPLATVATPSLLAASDTRAFWVTSAGALNTLVLQPAAAPAQIGTVSGAVALAANASFAYVATTTSIVRYAAAGGAPPDVMASGQKDITSILLVDDELYWASAGDSMIHRMNAN